MCQQKQLPCVSLVFAEPFYDDWLDVVLWKIKGNRNEMQTDNETRSDDNGLWYFSKCHSHDML